MYKHSPAAFQKKSSATLADSFFLLKNEIRKNRQVNEAYKTQPARKVQIKVSRPTDEGKKAMLEENKFFYERLVLSASGEDRVTRLSALRELAIKITIPEVCETVIDYEIVEKVGQMFRRFKQGTLVIIKEEETLVLKIFRVLSQNQRGAEQIANLNYLVNEFYVMILNMHRDQETIATILRNLTEKTVSLQAMVRIPNLYDLIQKILTRAYCTLYYPQDFWIHLTNLIEFNPKDCLAVNLFDVFINRIKKELTNYVEENMKCLALVLSVPEGQDLLFKIRGMRLFYDILCPMKPPLENYEYILLAMRNATKSDILVEDCKQFSDLPDILINLAAHRNSINEQLYALETLKHISKIFCAYTETRSRCVESLRRVKSLSQTAEHIRLDLLRGASSAFDYTPPGYSILKHTPPFPINDSSYIPPY